MENKWISYIGRSYNTIKSNFRNKLPSKLPELTDYSQSNLLMIILDQVAGLIEVLNFYVDNAARELYVNSARRFSSLLRLANNFNYSGKARISSKADVEITLENSEGDLVNAPEDIPIPKYSLFQDTSGSSWLTLDNSVFLKGYRNVVVQVAQISQVQGYELGFSSGASDQIFNLPTDVEEGSIHLEVASEVWERVSTFVFSDGEDKHYKSELGLDGQMKILFGDGVNGKIPPTSQPILINYNSTLGGPGNTEADTINTPPTLPYITPGYSLICTNPAPSNGGYKIEGVEKLRKAIPDSLYTQNRVVTRKDYERVASNAPGVRAAKLDHRFPVYPIKIYVAPNEGGVASQALLDSTNDFIQQYGLIGPVFDIKPSGESKVVFNLDIYGSYGAKKPSIQTEVEEALTDLYHPQKTSINKPIYVSDFYYRVKELDSVSHLILNSLYINPYLRPDVYDTSLIYKIRLRNSAIEKEEWGLTYITTGTPKIQLYRGGNIIEEFSMSILGSWQNNVGNLDILDLYIELISTDAPIVNWKFTIYPINKDILLDNFSVPIVDLVESKFTIIEKTDG